MAGSQFQKQLEEGISKWLNSGEKSGLIEVESDKVVLSSTLGKRAENQDRAIFLRVRFDESRKPPIAVLVLCDGMGGMVSGGDCATLAISTFATSIVHNNKPTLKEKLEIGVLAANQAVYNTFQGQGGATLSAVVYNNLNEWAAINVGDSRIYCLLDNGILKQLTVDDTLEQQLVNMNLSSPQPEFRQLLQYIGMGEGIQPRHIPLESTADIRCFLITSDGSHSIHEDVFKRLVSYSKTPIEIVERLTELSEWLGGKDNSTAAVLAVGKDLFSSNQESNFSSLEIWGIPGKAEFFSIKPISSEVVTNQFKTSDEDTNNPSKSNEKPIKEKPKKNNKAIHKQRESKEANSSKIYDEKSKVDQTVPQLNIDFSEDN